MRLVESATTVPDLPPGFVSRDNVTLTLDEMLQGDADVIVVQGASGVGKTTTLNTYARTHATRVISLFLKPIRSSYSETAICEELYGQLAAATGHSPDRTALTAPTRSDINQLIHRYALRLRQDSSTAVFVVDGLSDVLDKDRAAAVDIVELLPLARRQFRTLASGAVSDLFASAGCHARPYQLTRFSLDETLRMFSGTAPDHAAVTKAHQACNGIVGHLAAIRRLVVSGYSIDDILANTTLSGLRAD